MAKAAAKGNKKKYIDLYYMLPEEVGAKKIAETLLEAKPKYTEALECWEEAGVLEILVGEDSSIDMELLELSEEERKDEFLVSNHVKCVYLVHTDDGQMQEVKTIFASLVTKSGGLLCSDSANFMPIIVKA